MHKKFLQLLRGPVTGRPLTLHDPVMRGDLVESGWLLDEVSGERWPVRAFVPRFVAGSHYSDSFGVEWKIWSKVQFDAENESLPMAGHTGRMFQAITGFPSDLSGKLVLDQGCGPGRFIDIVRRRNGTVIGIEASGAADVARENFKDDPDVFIIQADLFNLPFAPGAFDHCYSIGVLHHTPDPFGGLGSLAKATKNGGHLALCVYPKDGFYGYPSVAAARRIINLLKSVSPRLAYRSAWLYASLSSTVFHAALTLVRGLPKGELIAGRIERYALVALSLSDRRWRQLDIFDAITPKYASTHTALEIRDWLARLGFKVIVQTDWGSTSFYAIK